MIGEEVYTKLYMLDIQSHLYLASQTKFFNYGVHVSVGTKRLTSKFLARMLLRVLNLFLFLVGLVYIF